MNRADILKLALQHTKDPREALEAAREMAAFLEGGTVEAMALPLPPPPPPPPPPPSPVVEAVRRVLHAPSPPAPAKPPELSRRNCAWREEEKNQAAALYDGGCSRLEIAQKMHRTVEGIGAALRDGIIPAKTYRKDPNKQLGGERAALNRHFERRATAAGHVLAFPDAKPPPERTG